MRERGKQESQQSLEQSLEPAFNLDKHQVLAVGGALLTTGIAEMATHNPVVLAAGILTAVAAGKLTPVVRDVIIGSFVPTNPDGAIDATEKLLDSLPIEDNGDLPQDAWSKTKRLLHIKEPEPAAAPKDAPRENTATRRAVKPLPGKAGKAGAGAAMIPAQFMMDEVIEEIRRVNRDGYVYFGRDASGESVVSPLNQMYHVFDVSSSGSGKGNRFRLAMAQMVNTCEVYYVNPLANGIKMTKDKREIEVWQPIFDRLANKRPMKTAEEIRLVMKAIMRMIARRRQQEADGDFSWSSQPVFVFFDELAETFELCPDAIEDLDRIGRIGRQYLVFCWVASQTAAVEEIGQSTAAQAQYKTRLYGGGDRNSSNRLMKGSVSMEAEQALQTQGEGLTLMLAEGFSGPRFVRDPLVTNEALFEYLRLPPFRLEEWLPAKKTLPATRAGNALDLSQAELPTLSQGLSRETFTANTSTSQAQNAPVSDVKGESRESVKGQEAPDIEVILDALNALTDEEKALTINAVMRKAGLTWRQTEEIEDVAEHYGFELVRGKGRPASK